MEKLQKTARILDTVAKLFFWFFIFAAVWYIGISLTMIYHLRTYIPSPGDYTVGEVVSFGSLKFSVVPGIVKHELDIKLALFNIVVVLCILVFGCFTIKIIRNILRPMAKARPFDMTVARNLRKLSYLSLTGGAAVSAATLHMEKTFFQAYDFQTLFLSDKITACTANYTFDCNFLLIFAVLYLLSFIFQYGAELQRQSDETL